MDEAKIRQYAALMRDMDLSAFELTEGGATLRLERQSTGRATPQAATAAEAPGVSPVVTEVPVPAAELPAVPVQKQGEDIVIASPMVGVFYGSPAENQAPFVSVGDVVKKGDVLCIIESMKLMNEIVAEHAGTITEVCVVNQEVVDYGHVLFRLQEG